MKTRIYKTAGMSLLIFLIVFTVTACDLLWERADEPFIENVGKLEQLEVEYGTEVQQVIKKLQAERDEVELNLSDDSEVTAEVSWSEEGADENYDSEVPGEYQFKGSATYQELAQDLTAEVEISVIVQEEARYSVTFAEANGLAGVEIALFRDVEKEDALEKEITTDSSGAAAVELADGEYWFQAEHQEYLTLDRNFTVAGEDKTVNFEMIEPEEYKLSVEKEGEGEGRIKVDDREEDLPFEAIFLEREEVVLQALAAEHSYFEAWHLADGSQETALEYRLKMLEGDQALKVEFAYADYFMEFQAEEEAVRQQGSNVTFTARVSDDTGSEVEGLEIAFEIAGGATADTGLSRDSAVTDAEGKASVELEPGDNQKAGVIEIKSAAQDMEKLAGIEITQVAGSVEIDNPQSFGSSAGYGYNLDSFSAQGNNPAAKSGNLEVEGTDEEEFQGYLIGFQSSAAGAAVQQAGGEIIREFSLINAAAVRMPAEAAHSLAARSDIKYVEPNRRVRALGQTVPWGIERVFADESYYFSTWQKSRGRNVGVAVLDTGIDQNHEDLPPLAGGINTIDDTHWGVDEYNHGTPVAGVIAARDNNLGVVGVAPEVEIYSVKVMDERGGGWLHTIIAGIEWAVDEGIPILNMSFGMGSYSEALKEAVDEAYSKGHLLIAAAGNQGDSSGSSVLYPAAFESVIAVAASDENDSRADFSSTGPQVELIAPGDNILSTFAGNDYGRQDGTSFSAPKVAGTAALAWSYDSRLSISELRQLLGETAEDLRMSGNYQGQGMVRPDNLLVEVKKSDSLADPFELQFKVEDLAGEDFVSAAEVVIEFKDKTSGMSEEFNRGSVDFSGLQGIKSLQVGTGTAEDIKLEKLSTGDINEIVVKVDETAGTVSGLNE